MDERSQSSGRSPAAEPGDLAAGPDCRESLTELYGYLDGELTVERRASIRVHLAACRGCLETYDFEAELRLVVSTCCKEKQVPPGLKERIAQVLRDLPEDA